MWVRRAASGAMGGVVDRVRCAGVRGTWARLAPLGCAPRPRFSHTLTHVPAWNPGHGALLVLGGVCERVDDNSAAVLDLRAWAAVLTGMHRGA